MTVTSGPEARSFGFIVLSSPPDFGGEEKIEQNDAPPTQVFADPTGRRALAVRIGEALLITLTIAIIVSLVAGTIDLGGSRHAVAIDQIASASAAALEGR